MTALTDRLRGIVHGTPSRLRPEHQAVAIFGGADPHLQSVASGFDRTGADKSLAHVLGGRWHDRERCFVVERRLEAGVAHGHTLVGDLARQLERASADGSLLTGGAPARAPFLFFDLETTGLSGGAGTYAFLVGCGWFDVGGSFVTRQHLLADYAVERSMLARVAAEFLGAGALVTFNGKSFDTPVLETRYLFHRLEWGGARLPHVDVLHPARRFWGNAAAGPRNSCSLVSLEEEILGVRRMGDVPGFEIPARYFHFVRSGDARPLAAVAEHNRLDLLSLAGLTARLLTLVREGPEEARYPWEALALGRVYARGGLDARARAAFERAIALTAPPAPSTSMVDTRTSMVRLRVDALRQLAMMLRRGRQYEEAADCWRRLLDTPSCPASAAREASEALAIHHEHRVRDLAAAKAFALRSLAEEFDVGTGPTGPARNDAVRHRLQRIERKIASRRSLFPSWPSPPSCGSPKSAHRTSS